MNHLTTHQSTNDNDDTAQGVTQHVQEGASHVHLCGTVAVSMTSTSSSVTMPMASTSSSVTVTMTSSRTIRLCLNWRLCSRHLCGGQVIIPFLVNVSQLGQLTVIPRQSVRVSMMTSVL